MRIFFASSPRTMKMMFLWLESTLWFSRKKGLSTPYSWRVLNLTMRPIVPAKDFSMTRFFLPRTCGRVSQSSSGFLRTTGTDSFQKMQKLSTSLVGDFLGVYGLCGRMGSHCHILSVFKRRAGSGRDVGVWLVDILFACDGSSRTFPLGPLTAFLSRAESPLLRDTHSHAAASFMKCFLRLAHFARTEATPLRNSVLIRPSPLAVARKAISTQTIIDSDDKMGKDKEGKTNFQLKVPKGTKDWAGEDMVIRDKIFGSITEVFKRHGAVTIDT